MTPRRKFLYFSILNFIRKLFSSAFVVVFCVFFFYPHVASVYFKLAHVFIEIVRQIGRDLKFNFVSSRRIFSPTTTRIHPPQRLCWNRNDGWGVFHISETLRRGQFVTYRAVGDDWLRYLTDIFNFKLLTVKYSFSLNF